MTLNVLATLSALAPRVSACCSRLLLLLEVEVYTKVDELAFCPTAELWWIASGVSAGLEPNVLPSRWPLEEVTEV